VRCPRPEVLAAWADGQVARELGEQLGSHTRGCSACARRVEHLRLLPSELARLTLAPAAAGFSAQVVAKLGSAQPTRTRSRRALLRAGAATGVFVAALALWMLAVLPRLPSARRGAELTARGAPSARSARVGFEVYAHQPGQAPKRLRAGQALDARSGYSFVVHNRGGRALQLMLFAVDARRDVHWFYPAFLDANTDPRSIRIDAQPQVQALPEGITPDGPALGPIEFLAVFTTAPLSVTEIEALLRAAGPDAIARAHPDAVLQRMSAELRAQEPAP